MITKAKQDDFKFACLCCNRSCLLLVVSLKVVQLGFSKTSLCVVLFLSRLFMPAINTAVVVLASSNLFLNFSELPARSTEFPNPS